MTLNCKVLHETMIDCMNMNDYTSFAKCAFIHELLKKYNCPPRR